MPTAMPAISPSASGVSATRSGPKRCCSPAVARNTPPFRPTSSPSTTTLSSSSMARASARLIASTSVMFDIALRLLGKLRELHGVLPRQPGVEVLEHLLGTRRRRLEIGLHHLLHVPGRFFRERLLLSLRPGAFAVQPGAQAHDWLLLPLLGDFLGAAIARGVVGGGVIRQPVGERLQQRGPASGSRLFHRAPDRIAHGDEIVAVE